jgi:uncharacterized protein (TIGR03067 family)
MTERDIFLAVLDLPDAAARTAYLDAACIGDAPRRAKVEALLKAHENAGSFLAEPAAALPEPGSRTEAFSSPPEDEALSFLSPSQRPDSLGRIGHYEVLEVLGRGGFGIVFRAFDEALQRVVAVKALAPSMAATSPARKRFLREARSSAQVRHENVVQVYAVEEQPLPYLVMEFIPGETLQQRLDRTGPLDVAETLRIGRQVSEGLAAAHAQGLIHRDIKPANVMIEGGTGHRAKLTDFGLARAADDASISQSGIVAGTPMYMAPEQAQGNTLDHRADLFSLGSVLYVMCSGRPPFRASGTLAVLKRVCEEEPRPIREIIPEVPEWLCRIVEKLHAKDPAARFQSAREVADTLADCERQIHAHSGLKDYSRIPDKKPTPRRYRRFAIALWLVAVLFWALLLYGEPAFLYVTNRGELELVPQKGLVSVIVLQNEEGVIDGEKLLPAATDWLDMKTSHTLKLSPGKYQLNAGAWPAGTKIVHWEVTTSRLLGSSRLLVPGLGAEGWSAILTVGRGEHVTVRAVMRDAPSTAVTAAPVPSTIAGTWESDWGPVTLEHGPIEGQTVVSLGGSYLQEPDKMGVITRGTYYPVKRTIQFTYAEPWWDGTGSAELKLSPDGNKLEGIWTNSAGQSGFWTMFRGPQSSDAAGWVQLFNGKDLTGWKTHPDKPGDWRVDDGVLIGLQGPSYLFSDRGDFENVHIRVEAKINKGGNSGVLFDSKYGFDFSLPVEPVGTRVPIGYEVEFASASNLSAQRTGSVFRCAPPLGMTKSDVERIADDTWTVLNIIVRGNHIVTRVNGQPATDFVDTAPPVPRGHIALQVHGPETVVRFRKVEIKELPANGTGPAPQPQAHAAEARWLPLFNGKSLAGWKRFGGAPATWTVDGGVLRAAGSASYLASDRDFTDFHLRTDVRINPGGSWRLLFRGDRAGLAEKNPSPRGLSAELAYQGQTGDVEGHMRMNLTFSRDGVPLAVNELNVKPNDWFPIDVTVQGDRVDIQASGGSVGGTFGRPLPPPGPIVLHLTKADAALEFRKIEIEELPADGTVPAEHAKGDHEKIQGAWKAVAADTQGRQVPDIVLKTTGPTLTFADNKVTWKANPTPEAKGVFGDELALKFASFSLDGIFHLDPTKSPKTIDLMLLGQIVKTPIGTPAPRAFLGIYKLEGDSLEICIAMDPDHAEERPGKFESIPGKAIGHVKLRRQPPAVSAAVESLRDLVAAKERALKMTEVRFEAGHENGLDLVLSQAALVEARIQLAEAEGDRAALLRDLQELVTRREEERRLTEVLLEAGRIRPDDLDHANGRVAEAKARLAKEQSVQPEPKTPAATPVSPPLAVAPFDASKAKVYQETWASKLGVPVEFTNSNGMRFRLIPPGEFTMGSSPGEVDWLLKETEYKSAPSWVQDGVRSEGPDRRVTIREPFYLGSYEVTVGQFREFVRATGYKTEAETNGGGSVWNVQANKWERKPEYVWTNSKYSPSESHPVVFITPTDARAFCKWLGDKDGRRYEIPTEEQWEWACRAGTTTRWSFGDDPTRMKEFGWTTPRSAGVNHPVGRLAPNPFGLYDMYGNAIELAVTPQNQPLDRGGDAGMSAWRSRSASRYNVDHPDETNFRRGLRVAIAGDLKAKISQNEARKASPAP